VILVKVLLAMTLLGVTPAPDSLSDQSLLQYASQAYDKGAMMNTRETLGIYHGNRVVVEFPCSDLCPADTVRVIRYELASGQDCSDAGGVSKTLRIPEGVAMHDEEFCFPRVLAEHWDRYKR